MLNESTSENQERISALVEGEEAEKVKIRELFSFEKFAEMYKK